jgi:hypothetical protein
MREYIYNTTHEKRIHTPLGRARRRATDPASRSVASTTVRSVYQTHKNHRFGQVAFTEGRVRWFGQGRAVTSLALQHCHHSSV